MLKKIMMSLGQYKWSWAPTNLPPTEKRLGSGKANGSRMGGGSSGRKDATVKVVGKTLCWPEAQSQSSYDTHLRQTVTEPPCHMRALIITCKESWGQGKNPPRSFARSLHSNTIYFIVPIHFTLFESSCPLLLVKTMLMVPTKGNSNEYRVLKSWCMDSDVLLAVAIPLNQCHFEECNVQTPACFLKVFHNTQSNEMSGAYMIKTNN